MGTIRLTCVRAGLAAGLAAGLGAAMSGAALAEGWSAGVGASTLGLGAEVSYAFSERVSVRGAGYSFSVDEDGEESGVDYEAELDLSSFGAYVDWRPFAGAFRVSAGWFATDNGIDARGRPGPGGIYELGDASFTTAEVGDLRGAIDLGSSAPYLGLGWRWGRDAGFGASLDLGVLFQDSPEVSLRSTGGTLSDDPLLLAALAQEEAELEDDVDDYELYPVLSLMLTYAF